jgi:hypothetical protein
VSLAPPHVSGVQPHRREPIAPIVHADVDEPPASAGRFGLQVFLAVVLHTMRATTGTGSSVCWGIRAPTSLRMRCPGEWAIEVFRMPKRHGSLCRISPERPLESTLTYRKLSRAVAVVALSAATLMALPASATAQPVKQVGYVADTCTGAGEDFTAVVQLVENSAFGAEATVRIETSAGGELFGATTDGPFFQDGTNNVVATVVDVATEEPAGTATVSGTYTVSGEPTRYFLRFNEGEEQVITVGTQTPLNVDLTLEYADSTIELECEAAFAFDYTVVVTPFGSPF